VYHRPDADGVETHTTTIDRVPVCGTDRDLCAFAFVAADDTRPGDHVAVVRDGCDPVLYRIDPRGLSVWSQHIEAFVPFLRPRR
tara:strand:- start:38 stop:289 length:252 start_codon:yes stop_codon:yes gene_type:complete